MHKSTLCLAVLLLIAALSNSQVINDCPYGLYNAAGTCKACELDADTCGSNPSCPQVYRAKDAQGVAGLCLPVPICASGQFFNKDGANQSQQICKPCSEAGQIPCSSVRCPGYFYNTVPTTPVCEPLPDCSEGTYYSDSSCLSCTDAANTDITTLICGLKSGCLGFYINGVDPTNKICSPCSQIPNVDLSITPLDNTYCVCAQGYYWDATTFTCLACSDITDGTLCKQCKNHVSNADSTGCLACSIIEFSNSTYNGVLGGCNCQVGYTWRASSASCVACDTAADANECGAETCIGYYFDNLKVSTVQPLCDLCSNTADTNATANDVLYGRTVCTCTTDLAWVVSDTAKGTCGDCGAAAKDLASCESATCPNWLYDDATDPAICTQSCSAAGAGAVSDSLMTNGECACLEDFVWNYEGRSCDSCGSLVNQTACKASCSGHFLWFAGQTKCLSCQGAKNTVKVDDSFFPVNGECTCDVGYKWNATTLFCDSCSARSISECAVGACSLYFINSNTCKICPGTPPPERAASTPLTSCECSPTTIWSNLTKTCFNCNPAQSALNIYNICVNCTLGATNNYNGTNDQSSCKCKTGYVWFNGTCSCNTTKLEFDKGNGAGCATCNLFPGGTTYNNITKGCNCVAGATWNATLKKCKCTNTAAYLLNNVCTLCSTLGSGVTSGGNGTFPDQCSCTATSFIWNTTLKTCSCIDITAIFKKNATVPTCESCTKLLFYSNGTRATPFSCYCREGMIWDAITVSCICDTASVASAARSTCISCKSLFGSTGLKASTTACACKTGWIWSATLRNCVCSTLTCACPSGFVLNASKICTNCSIITGATGFALSLTACECVKSYVWNTTASTCDCPKGGFTNGAKSYCRFCDIYSNSTGKFATTANTSCACLPNYAWVAANQQCEFIPLTPTIITLLNGTKVSCKTLLTSTGFAQDSFNCKCAAGKVWNDYTNECLACSTVVNSTGKVVGIYACGCNNGSYWDLFSFTCKLNTCKYVVTDARCAYCIKHPGNVVSAQLLIVTAYEKPALLSGDNLFSYYAKQGSSQYLNYTSYKCLCATNYIWSVARRRCYNKTLNATA